MNPLVSVIIPVYNVEKYLNECVSSVVNQTYKDIEILLIDDGSPDKCPQICDEYAESDLRIKVIHKENGGLSDARNVGLNNANGEWIVFLDSDDKLADEKCIENISNFFSAEIDILYLNSTISNFSEEIKNSKNEFVDYKIFLKRILKSKYKFMTAWSFICRKNFLINNNLFFEKKLLHEDELWSPLILSKNKKQIFVFSELFYFYRLNRNGSIMNSVKDENLFAKIYISEKLKSFTKNIFDKNAKKFILTRAAQIFTYVFRIGKKNIETNDELKRQIKKSKNILLKSSQIKHWILYMWV